MTAEDRKECRELLAAKLKAEFSHALNQEMAERMAEIALETVELLEQYSGENISKLSFGKRGSRWRRTLK